MKELIVVYLRDVFKDSVSCEKSTLSINQASTARFFSYRKNETDSLNFTYLVNQLMACVQAITNYNVGIRRNNLFLSQSALYEVAHLFHG